MAEQSIPQKSKTVDFLKGKAFFLQRNILSVGVERLGDAQVLHFDLYVVDNYPKAALTISNLEKICRRMRKKCMVNRIDLAENPSLAKEKGIVATPMIIRTDPFPEIRLVGTLSDHKRATAFLSR